MTSRLTTDAATQILATLYARAPYLYSDEPAHDRAVRCLRVARDRGLEWAWDDAERALRLAYRSIGATPPAATGYDWHCGKHPIQVAIAATRPSVEV